MARLAVLLLLLAMMAGATVAGAVTVHRAPIAAGTSTTGTNGDTCALCL
jgi:hypothetical protein